MCEKRETCRQGMFKLVTRHEANLKMLKCQVNYLVLLVFTGRHKLLLGLISNQKNCRQLCTR